MKINEHFVLRNIYGQYLLFPISRNTVGNELISFNEIGSDIWTCAEKGLTEQEIVDEMDKMYGLEKGSVEEESIRVFINALCEKELLFRTEED